MHITHSSVKWTYPLRIESKKSLFWGSLYSLSGPSSTVNPVCHSLKQISRGSGGPDSPAVSSHFALDPRTYPAPRKALSLVAFFLELSTSSAPKLNKVICHF